VTLIRAFSETLDRNDLQGKLMGHTVISQRILTESILSELQAYGKSLHKEEREIYEQLLKQPLKHIGNISYTSSVNAWAFILISIILEQEKRFSDRCIQAQEQPCTLDEEQGS